MTLPPYRRTWPDVAATARTHPGPSASLSHPAYTWSTVDGYSPQLQAPWSKRCCPPIAWESAYERAATAWASMACRGHELGTSPMPYPYSWGVMTPMARRYQVEQGLPPHRG